MEEKSMLVAPKIAFQEYACKRIGQLQERYKQLSDKIKLYRQIHPNLVYLLERERKKLGDNLLDITTAWSLSGYEQLGSETRQDWMGKEFPLVSQRNFEQAPTGELSLYLFG